MESSSSLRLSLRVEGISYQPSVKDIEQDAPHIFLTPIREALAPTRNINVLNKVALDISSGSVHAVIAPPGHGKSALLKAIAGLLPQDDITAGRILFASDTSQGWVIQQQLLVPTREHGAMHKLVAFVDQVDFHYPRLTVHEVLLEAAQLTNAPLPQETAAAYNVRLAARVQEVIQLLGLGEAANTIVGDRSLRGISGGQRRRLSLGEMLVTPARIILADQITDGLDSSTARDIMQALAQWAHSTGAVVITTVNQPTPEVLATTDGVVLLREGSVVYSGAFDGMQTYFTDVLRLSPPLDMDLADFAIELLSDPGFVSGQYRQEAAGDANSDGTAPLPPPSGTAQLVAAYADWRAGQGAAEEAEAKLATGPLLEGEAQVATFGDQYAHSWGKLLGMQLSRQWSMLIRNTRFVGVRVFQQIVIGLILGSLFYDLGSEDFVFRLGLLAFVPPHLGFTAIGELPLYIEFKKPVSKQRNAGFYPSSAYVIAGLLVLLPLALLDLVLLSSLLLPLTGIQGSVEQAFFFILLHFLFVVAISAQFRAIAFFAPNLEAAQVMAAPVTGTYSLANGFVGRSVLSVGGIGLAVYWLSPMSWMLRSSAHMEFLHSDDYSRAAGEAILESLDIQTDDGWLWGGVAYVIAFAAVWIVLALISFDNNNRNLNIGKQRPELIQAARRRDAVASGKQPPAAVGDVEMATIATKESSARGAADNAASVVTPRSAVVPSSDTVSPEQSHPTTVLSWEDINYTVGTKQGPKQLLHNITGYAKGGQLTALMGATGAGKSTLSDVLLLRKNTGDITGDLYLDGVRVSPSDKTAFVRQTGYVEQFDEINPLQTVAEVVRFAADLRLPASTTAEERAATVTQVLRLLELATIGARAVGMPGMQGALSQSERKRLAIAQEIVARPRVLLLDEPTTGLDARAAREVLDVVKMTAQAWGMVVICTIHAPSAELFFEFDNLLLLAPGGHTAYFGPIAAPAADSTVGGGSKPVGRAGALQHYLEGVPGVTPLPPATNPASWMMDAVNADVASDGSSAAAGKVPIQGSDVDQEGGDVEVGDTPAQQNTPTAKPSNVWQVWGASDLAKSTREYVESLRRAGGTSTSNARVTSDLPGSWAQLRVLVARTWTTFSRNIDYNTQRIMISVTMGFVFGAVFTDGGLDNEKNTVSGVISQLGLTFNTLIFILFPNLLAVNVSFFQERSSYYREHGDMKLYSAWVFVLGRFLVEMVYIAFTTLAFVTPLYWIAGLRADAGVFFHFWLVGYIIALTFSLVGLQSANQFATLEVSSLQGSFGARILLAFGGLFIGRDQMPAGWRWLHDISPLSNAQKAIAGPQFECLRDEALDEQRACALVTIPTGGPVPAVIPAESFVGSVYDVFADQQWERTLYAVLPLFVILALTMVTFATKRHDKR